MVVLCLILALAIVPPYQLENTANMAVTHSSHLVRESSNSNGTVRVYNYGGHNLLRPAVRPVWRLAIFVILGVMIAGVYGCLIHSNGGLKTPTS